MSNEAQAEETGTAGRGGGRLERLRWYRNRLASMSAPEVAFRVHEQVRRAISRRLLPNFAAAVNDDGAAAGFPALPGLAQGVGRLAGSPGMIAAWQDMAARVRDNRFEALGVAWPARGGLPGWHLDPVSGREWPDDVYCFDVRYRHSPGYGDVKYVWELNRLQYLQPLAALSVLAEDEDLAELVIGHVESWIDGNPPFRGVHWASGIELALRIVSLLVVCSLLGPERFSADRRRKLLECLAAHGYWLKRYPSRYSSANNHRVAEGAGLFLLGALAPQIRWASRWQAYGRAVLEAEVQRQFHADGVGAEQSPTYTAFSLEWMLLCQRVARLLGAPFSDAYTQKLLTVGSCLRAFSDAAGNQPRIGDDDEGFVLGGADGADRYVNSVLSCLAADSGHAELAPPRLHLQFRNALFGIPDPSGDRPEEFRHFPDGGYSVARNHDFGVESLFVFDHGPLGFLAIAAHGHADTLGVWLHVGGRPVLIDAGTYLYHAGADWRDHFRSTAAHNTLSIGGDDSSVISGPFNWSRKATCRLREVVSDPAHWAVEAEHDGFVENYAYRHRRRVERIAPGRIDITDWLDGEGGAERIEVGFLFAPDLTVSMSSRGWLVTDREHRRILQLRHAGPLKGWVESGLASPKRGWFSPRFGHKQPASRLVFAGKMWEGLEARFTIEVEPPAGVRG